MGAKKEKGRKAAQIENRRRRTGKRRGRRTLHHLVVIVFLLTTGAVLSLTVFFKIDAIVVTGTDRYAPEELADFSGITLKEDNLFRISAEAISQQLLEAHPYIETVEIHRRIPATVEIEVRQSVPAGALEVSDEEYVLITKDGKVLERGLLMIPENVPLVKGVPAGNTQPGQYLGVWEAEPKEEGESDYQKEAREKRNEAGKELADQQAAAMKMLHKLFEAMEDTGFDNITNVDITNPVNMKINYENRMLLELGNESELSYKLRFVQTVLSKLAADAHGTLDVTNPDKKRLSYLPAEDYDSKGYHIHDERPENAEEEFAERAGPDAAESNAGISEAEV